MVREDKSTWKANYFIKIEKLFDTYSRCFIVSLQFYSSDSHEMTRLFEGEAVKSSSIS